MTVEIEGIHDWCTGLRIIGYFSFLVIVKSRGYDSIQRFYILFLCWFAFAL